MPRSILIVDDDQDIRLMLQDGLTFLGFYDTTARDGTEGMAMLKVWAIGGILLDMHMPVMNGVVMLEKVRERYPNIPVIAMTAESNKKMLIQAMDLGAQDYLIKPIDSNLLVKKCCTVFEPIQAKCHHKISSLP